MTLGERFVPGNDEKHFCKPTDVAVSNDGEKIFVADGYCNSRVVVLDSKGNFVRQYSTGENEDQLVVPHSLTLIEHLNLLCVADRENQRLVLVLCSSSSRSVSSVTESFVSMPDSISTTNKTKGKFK